MNAVSYADSCDVAISAVAHTHTRTWFTLAKILGIARIRITGIVGARFTSRVPVPAFCHIAIFAVVTRISFVASTNRNPRGVVALAIA